MTEPVIGITFTRDDNEPRPVVASDMSVFGIVGTAPDADEDAFPLDTPIAAFSNDTAMLTALGATGTLPDAIRAINAQLGEFQVAARGVIVRVEAGDTTDETIAALAGDEADRTGLFALLDAGPVLARIPRLITVPGHTHQVKQGVTAVVLSEGGTGYTSPVIGFTGGGGTGATAEATVEDGVITAIEVTDPGDGYTTAPTVTITDDDGAGAAATATVSLLANPVCAALPSVLERLLAHAVVEGPGTTRQAAIDWRETLSSDRLIPVDAWVKVQDGASIVTRPGAPRIVGIAIRRDYEKRGVPSHSWANQAMQGIIGLVRNVDFSLTDGATEGQDLLSYNIGVAVRGELGVESAISSSGFVFLGTDNAGDDPVWQFYNVTRMRDFVHLGLLRTLRWYLGRYNIDEQTIQAVLNTTGFFLRDLKADRHILGYTVGFETDKNSPEQLRLGRFRFYFQAEEPPVLRRLDIDSRRHRAALEEMLENLIARVNDLVI